MEQETLQVLAVQHKQGNTRLKFVSIENTLEAFQKFVSEGSEARGEIEIVPVSGSIVCVLHGEGKVIGLPPTLAWIKGEEVIDVLAGDIFFCREGEEGELANIEKEDIDFIREHFRLIKTEGGKSDGQV